jgi:hypothetical protein
MLKSLKEVLSKKRSSNTVEFDDLAAIKLETDKKKTKADDQYAKKGVNIFEFDWEDVHESDDFVPIHYQYGKSSLADKENRSS